ncbi:hypothetical protein K488DRAFT_76414 [Vararia minispora EC-137]|uniref:Uncharacterized protein n=1 Tax=Vararia minispora EC-137 TaxID=1314806 RepID=A0ACB8QWJ8_9AGAM|nr:hypothetical protein K488DRAFT_76414 [Vararia minispora EC-137]
MSEQEPLLPVSDRPKEDEPARTLREWTAEALESRWTHRLVIFLTLTDSGCVLADLCYTLLAPGCEPPKSEPVWLEVLANVSLAITFVFLLEIPLTIWSLGFRHYVPGKVPHAPLHLFDAAIIITTFVLEFVLRGRERELAELLIVLRLWRVVKLVGGVAVGATEIQEEDSEEIAELKRELERVQEQLVFIQEENRTLRARLGSSDVSS